MLTTSSTKRTFAIYVTSDSRNENERCGSTEAERERAGGPSLLPCPPRDRRRLIYKEERGGVGEIVSDSLASLEVAISSRHSHYSEQLRAYRMKS